MQFIEIHRYKKRLHHILQNAVDLIFPRSCISCGVLGTALCNTCLLGIPKPADNLPKWVHALYTYKSAVVKQSIWKLKYSHTHDIARVYGKALCDRIIEDCGDQILFKKETLVLIPIPVSPQRLRERGYNQAALLVASIRRYDTSCMFVDGSSLLKLSDTFLRQSHTKNRTVRLQNIIGSFYTTKHLSGKAHYIIIDDVVTTGATLIEARKILRLAGAQKVSAYTIAH